MSVTIKDIAKCAMVSYATVSRALSDQPGISKDTKEKIRRIAKEMGYTPNAVARGLVTRNTHTVGLVIPDITNPFFPEVALGIEECANWNGYQVFLCSSGWNLTKEKESLSKLMESRVDGIVIGPVSDDIAHIVELDSKVPVIFAAYRPQVDNCCYIVTDDYKSAVIAAEYLIKLGHRKIAFIGGREKSSTSIDRYNAYRYVLQKSGISLNPNYILHGEYSQLSGYQLAKNMLINHDTPTAILAGNDIIALGVIQAIEEFGLKVPKDISVIGFDDISFAALDKIQLTTVCQPKFDLGRLCMEMLLKRMQSDFDKKDCARVLEPELIIRKTCRGI